MDRPALGFPRISTVFDHDKDSPHSILYASSIRNTLMKLLPSNFFLFDEAPELLVDELPRLMPIVKWASWGEQGLQLSIYLLCGHRTNGVKFFYEMISRWLMPGRRPCISSFFSTDFKLPELSSELFTVCEIVISLENSASLEQVMHQLPILESEIKMGLLSVYHASRILEIKGLSADEKTSLIQERIVSLLEKRPKDIDYDIFAQMQHFLVMCSDEFKAVREYAHMSRIIYVFYLFRRALKNEIEKSPAQRFVHVKLSRTYLHHAFGRKKVLGIFAALNFQGENELFEERHFVAVLISHFPHLEVIEESFFFRTSKEERIQLLYLEVEKRDGTDFTILEVKGIKERLADEIRNGIEKLTRPLFMPRNEEDVMRNIITLSNQLKFTRDLPQVIINFDAQEESELAFTVICLRVYKETDEPIKDLFEKSGTYLRFIPDRIKRLGLLRKKYPKEATVFRVKFSAHSFLRSDHSVDLLKARGAIVHELERILGEFRDFNGGMISKQNELFETLRRLVPVAGKNEELLLENFFHSIFPIEHRSVFNPLFLKDLYLLLHSATQKCKEEAFEAAIFHENQGSCCNLLLSYRDPALKHRILEYVRNYQIPSSQLLTVELEYLGVSYLGYIYFEEDDQKRDIFLKGWENLTFELQISDT